MTPEHLKFLKAQARQAAALAALRATMALNKAAQLGWPVLRGGE